jgi:hypothetical protein
MLRFGMPDQRESAAMKCLHIYATLDGESHFDEVELPTMKMSVHPDAVAFDVSASYPAPRVRLIRIPAGLREVAWHTVPESNLCVRLDGSVEYETSDGQVRHVPAGSFVLGEDTHGKGHLSRHSAQAQTVIWMSLPNGLNLPPDGGDTAEKSAPGPTLTAGAVQQGRQLSGVHRLRRQPRPERQQVTQLRHWSRSEDEPALLVLVENDHCVSAGDRVKWNQVVSAPISPGKNSLVYQA